MKLSMNKLKATKVAGLILLSVVSFSAAAGMVERFSENGHYQKVVPAQAEMGIEKSKDKIDVVEFFLYSCSHCFRLEPKLAAWAEENKDKVNFRRVPAVLTPNWVSLAKAYYVAEELGILEQTHDALFKSIVEDKKVYLNAMALAQFFKRYGVKQNDFVRRFNSKSVVDKVSDARILSAKYQFRGVPIVVVNDQYKTAPFYTKDQEQMIEVMDFLVAKSNNK